MKKELKIGLDDALSAAIGNPNKKSKGTKNREYEKLIEQRKSLMKNVAKRDTDLETYMKAIGALSISKDKRVTSQNNFDDEHSESTMEIVESSRNSIGGDALRQLRANINFSSTFASTQIPPSFAIPSTPTTSTTPTPEIPPKLTLEEGSTHAINRLAQANMVLSSTQPSTLADGNCFIYAILDQLMYDPNLRFVPFSHDTFRSSIVSSFNSMISQGRIVSPFTDEQRQNWILRMGTNTEYCDHIFIQLCANILDRNIEIFNVMSNQRTIISPVNGGGGHLIYSPLYVMFYEESHFYAPHYQSIRPRQVPQAPVTNSTNVPATRPPLPSVNSTIGHPILHSTNINQTTTCENTCNAVRSRNTRETSYIDKSNIIEKRTRSSRK